jgi:hypothetical protein
MDPSILRLARVLCNGNKNGAIMDCVKREGHRLSQDRSPLRRSQSGFGRYCLRSLIVIDGLTMICLRREQAGTQTITRISSAIPGKGEGGPCSPSVFD